jgi:hypothetical protein
MGLLRPRGRTGGLLVEEIDDQLLVYDQQRDVVCSLNGTAAIVWRSCDGDRTVEDLVDVLRAEIGEIADIDLVMVTLDQLEEHGLIEAGYGRRDRLAAQFNRRRFISRVGVVTTAAVALPVVQSIVAPTPAAADSNYYYYQDQPKARRGNDRRR